MQFGADEYRRGALERLDDARTLLKHARWAGAAYCAGRAVESLLRALLGSGENESGHNLRQLFKQAGSVGLLCSRDEDQLYDPINTIAGVWSNNLRFADEQRFLKHLKSARKDRGIKGDPVEYWARRLVECSEAVISRKNVI